MILDEEVWLRAHITCESAKVSNYKMQNYMRKYFCSLFTFTAVSATSDCQLQTDERSYDVHPSAELYIGLL